MVLECARMQLSSNKNITTSNIIIVIIITCCLLKDSVYRLDYITVITANNILERKQKDKVVARYYVLRAYHEHDDDAKRELVPNTFYCRPKQNLHENDNPAVKKLNDDYDNNIRLKS